jgi:hypothetical protein
MIRCSSTDSGRKEVTTPHKYLTVIDTLATYDPATDSIYFGPERALSRTSIVNYIDGSCLTCVEDLIYWKKIIDKLDNKSLDFRFYFYANNFPSVKGYIRRWRFGYPIYLDRLNTFYTVNKLRPEKETHSFVVNEKGEVIYDKNPVYDSTAFKYYMKTFARAQGGK